VFLQTVDGFRHLENNGILHRDVRPKNILVSTEGVTKIIDFGFGKRVASETDFGKSITLNWWCEPPKEFASSIYDHRTEVYFVGKLFQTILRETGTENFSYSNILDQMCEHEPASRIDSFEKINSAILAGRISEIPFSESDLELYRSFSSDLFYAISKIAAESKYFHDSGEILGRLEDVYRVVMLEDVLPSSVPVIRCFVNGDYYYSKRNKISAQVLRGFIELLRRCSREKRDIVISNIHSRLDTVTRYNPDPFPDSDIPF
jgi:serine/threonine-protein kinase